MWVRGHSRSLKFVPFESLGAVSYSPSIVTMAVSVAVCEIFSVKEWRDLENQVRGRSRSWNMAPFDRPCDFLLVGHCKYSSIWCHFRVIWRWIISWPWNRGYIYRGHSMSLKLVPFESLDAVSVRWKNCDDVKPFSSDTGTLQTNGQICYINIMLTRDKNIRGPAYETPYRPR